MWRALTGFGLLLASMAVGFTLGAVGYCIFLLLRWRATKRRENKNRIVRFVSYEEAETLLKQGWILAIPEEDTNRRIGWVYLERKT